MLPPKPIFERKDGTSVIFIQYCYSSEKRTTLNTEIDIPPAFWNKKNQSISKDLPPSYGDFKELNSELKRMPTAASVLLLMELFKWWRRRSSKTSAFLTGTVKTKAV